MISDPAPQVNMLVKSCEAPIKFQNLPLQHLKHQKVNDLSAVFPNTICQLMLMSNKAKGFIWLCFLWIWIETHYSMEVSSGGVYGTVTKSRWYRSSYRVISHGPPVSDRCVYSRLEMYVQWETVKDVLLCHRANSCVICILCILFFVLMWKQILM